MIASDEIESTDAVFVHGNRAQSRDGDEGAERYQTTADEDNADVEQRNVPDPASALGLAPALVDNARNSDEYRVNRYPSV